MEDRKIPFLKRVKLAIFNLERYQDFALEKFSVAFKYFLKLVLFFSIIICFGFAYEYMNIAKSGIQLIKEEIPDFTFEDYILSSKSEDPTVIEKSYKNTSYIIIIDTNMDEDSSEFELYDKKLNLYNTGVIFLKDRVWIKNGVMDKKQSLEYEELAKKYNIDNFDKKTITDSLDNINFGSAYIALYLTLVLYLFCTCFIAILLDTVPLFVLGYVTARIVSVGLNFKQIYGLTFYSLTLPVLINAVYIPINLVTGFEVKYFQLMYTAISCIYIITAILLIRSEIIKQQIEVRKIEEVQKEVKKEIEEKKEEKQDDNDDNNEEDDQGIKSNEQEPEGTI